MRRSTPKEVQKAIDESLEALQHEIDEAVKQDEPEALLLPFKVLNKLASNVPKPKELFRPFNRNDKREDDEEWTMVIRTDRLSTRPVDSMIFERDILPELKRVAEDVNHLPNQNKYEAHITKPQLQRIERDELDFLQGLVEKDIVNFMER